MKPNILFNEKVLDVKDDVFEKIEDLYKDAAHLRDLIVRKNQFCATQSCVISLRSVRMWDVKEQFFHGEAALNTNFVMKKDLTAHEQMCATQISQTLKSDIEKGVHALKKRNEAIIESLITQDPGPQTKKVSLGIRICDDIQADIAWTGPSIPSPKKKMDWDICLDKERDSFLNACLGVRHCALQEASERSWHIYALTRSAGKMSGCNACSCMVLANTQEDAFAKACQIDGNIIIPSRVLTIDINEKRRFEQT